MNVKFVIHLVCIFLKGAPQKIIMSIYSIWFDFTQLMSNCIFGIR